MAKKSILKHGFKASAERLAIKYREDLGFSPFASLCAFKLAEYLNVPVISATELLNDRKEHDLLSGSNGKACEWSALTMDTRAGNRIILHNPFHSIARQQSDLMHELAHIICKHERIEKKYDFNLPVGLLEYNIEQEEEAKYLGSTLQISKPGLHWAKKCNMTIDEIAAHFNASKAMVIYRNNITGISKIYN